MIPKTNNSAASHCRFPRRSMNVVILLHSLRNTNCTSLRDKKKLQQIGVSDMLHARLLGVIIYSLSQRNAGSKFKSEKCMQFAFVSVRVQNKLHSQSGQPRSAVSRRCTSTRCSRALARCIKNVAKAIENRNLQTRCGSGSRPRFLVNLNLLAGDFFSPARL